MYFLWNVSDHKTDIDVRPAVLEKIKMCWVKAALDGYRY